MGKDTMKYSIKTDSDIHAVVVETTGIINTVVAEEMVMNAGSRLSCLDVISLSGHQARIDCRASSWLSRDDIC